MLVVRKLQGVKTPTDVPAVLRMMRRIIVSERKHTYEELLERCLHTEDITSRIDPIYPVFEQDVAAVLENKSEDEQILTLTQMLMTF